MTDTPHPPTPEQLCDHGLAPPEQRAALDAVAARYAVALPPALADLIDPQRSA